MSTRSGGRFLCDSFHVVPRGSSDEFAPALAELASREGADVVFPQSSGEVVQFAANRQLFTMPLMVASPEAIEACDDKAQTMALAARAGVKAPRAHLARTPGGISRRRRRARLSGGGRVHEAAAEQGLARVPRALGERRPPPCAARGAPRPAAALAGGGAGGHRRRRLPAAPRDGARDRQGAHRRRHLPRRSSRARSRQDARGDARRPGDVLRDGRSSPSSRRPRGASSRRWSWTGS